MKDPLVVGKVIKNFHWFHCRKKNHNPYYSEIRGDHTAAIRLEVFLELNDRFEKNELEVAYFCKKLIQEELRNLQRPEMYRSGHNHALMVDLSILKAYKKGKGVGAINLKTVVDRAFETLKFMWHASGLTTEHSVSYQEYNLPITCKFLGVLESLCISVPDDIVSLEKLKEESRRFLGYSLRSNGEYFPVGDSFRKPNIKLLQKVFCDAADGKQASDFLKPYAREEGGYVCEDFFIFRGESKGKQIHFIATCGWNSHHHKQNDELSFCLDIDGESVFEDPGFTDRVPGVGKSLRKESHHSTIGVKDESWFLPTHLEKESCILDSDFFGDGFKVVMKTKKINNIVFIREFFFFEGVLTIKDSVMGEVAGKEIMNWFVLGPDVCPEAEEDIIYLKKKGEAVAAMRFDSTAKTFPMNVNCSPSLIFDKIDIVLSERKMLGISSRLECSWPKVAGNSFGCTISIGIL